MKEKKITIGSQVLNYMYFEWIESKWNIVILHWWWGKSRSWENVGTILQKSWYSVYIPDLPGFGKSPLNKAYTIKTYAKLIEDFLLKLEISPLVLLGHSNGWAIASQIVWDNNLAIEKLILNNSAGVRLNFKRKLKRLIFIPIVVCAKLLSFLPFFAYLRKIFYIMIWSRDYINSEKDNPYKKATYLNMIGTDMLETFRKIHIPTLLLRWEKDTFTPLWDAKKIRLNIPDSQMIIIPNQAHSIHLKNPIELSRNILAFIQ